MPTPFSSNSVICLSSAERFSFLGDLGNSFAIVLDSWRPISKIFSESLLLSSGGWAHGGGGLGDAVL